MQPVISFEQYRITSIDYKVYESIEELKENSSEDGSLQVSSSFSEGYDKARLILKATVKDESLLRVADVEVTGYFNISSDINLSDAQSYLHVNGTAILFPYVRAVVSIITTMDNDKAVILPTINTSSFGTDFQKDSEPEDN